MRNEQQTEGGGKNPEGPTPIGRRVNVFNAETEPSRFVEPTKPIRQNLVDHLKLNGCSFRKLTQMNRVSHETRLIDLKCFGERDLVVHLQGERICIDPYADRRNAYTQKVKRRRDEGIKQTILRKNGIWIAPNHRIYRKTSGECRFDVKERGIGRLQIKSISGEYGIPHASVGSIEIKRLNRVCRYGTRREAEQANRGQAAGQGRGIHGEWSQRAPLSTPVAMPAASGISLSFCKRCA